MDNNNKRLLQSLTNAPIAEIHYMPGGCVGEVWQVCYENGDCLVAKTSDYGHHLHIEGQMLQYLNDNSSLPVPKTVLVRPDLLVMEFIETAPATDASPALLAQHIAALHNITADDCGFDYDTLIGPLPQPNPKCDSWVRFFATHRLLYMARLAFDVQAVSKDFCTSLEKLCGRLHDYISEPQEKSLLHGDLWFGNILYKQGGDPAFIDPAIYYGDSEIEIAYSQMFASIADGFLSEYNNLRPLSANFKNERMPLYHLYPLLVHARLFGGGYGGQAHAIVRRFA